VDVPAAGFTFKVRLAGPKDGEPVVLLHGFPETSYEWRYQMKTLAAAGYRVIAPDQRGYSPGARPEAVSAYALPLLVVDVLSLTTALGADRFHVVGHDWGAAVAWGVALFAPQRVLSLTSVSIPHPGALERQLADPTSCQHAASSYFDSFAAPGSEDLFLINDAWLLRAAYAGLSTDAIEAYLGVLRSKVALGAALNWYRANVSHREIVGAVDLPATVPTLLVWGDQDPYICREGIDGTASFVRAPYRLEVLAGVGHFVPELAPDRVGALLLEHLRSIQH
jgi:pimeloyl-ACP methyl ester carboxylesterase